MKNTTDRLPGPAKPFNVLYYIIRGMTLFSVIMLFLPSFFGGRISSEIVKYCSTFTAAVSFDNLTANLGKLTRYEDIMINFKNVMRFSGVIIAGSIVASVGGCMSLGNAKMRRTGTVLMGLSGIFFMVGSLGYKGLFVKYGEALVSNNRKQVPLEPTFAIPFLVIFGSTFIVLGAVLTLYEFKHECEEKMEMLEKYKLFLYILPIIMLTFVFSYLPLWGWRYAFFDYKSGASLTKDNFVGFKWFLYLFQNEETVSDIIRVLKNTLIMSGLGILTSWFPIAFAVFLSEIRSTGFRKTVQILTTIPNFISWVLVYAIAFALFSTEGFVNDIIEQITGAVSNTNYLQNDNLSYLKMLLWGVWKGLGWSAIIYIAAISGVDQSLYEAAMVDGAGRFKRMWHITLPALIPTYCVMLMLSIANILSNGMEQYLVFSNARNQNTLEVLDLYVYQLGIASGGGNLIPLSTVVSMAKSLISVALLFIANTTSKLIRGESII